MCDDREIEDAANLWVSYAKQKALLVAEVNNEAAGMINLYLSPYDKLNRQALFAVIVQEKFRSQGVGRRLIEEMMEKAREEFGLDLIHLEVYDGNPAIRLYERLGFERYGYHPNFIKWKNEYLGKILMQKKL